MKALITINRHIVRNNKKQSKATNTIVDEPAISIRTYKDTTYCKKVVLPQGATLIQDAAKARCNGATIWIEVADFNDLIID